jgi:FdhE protein
MGADTPFFVVEGDHWRDEEMTDVASSARKGVFSLEQRIARAQDLAGVYPSAAEVLGFYAKLLELQGVLYRGFEDQCRVAHVGGEGCLLDYLNMRVLLPQYPLFLSFVQKNGPAELAQAAEEFNSAGEQAWEELLVQYWQGTLDHPSPVQTFFAMAYLQPYTECVADHMEAPADDHHGKPTCPVCDAEPIAAVLRPEGHGARRSLICSLCSSEWDFPRLVCPACGETRFEALAVYTASEFEHVRVDACETCHNYIKTVDLSKNGLAVPMVDELATIPLTLWAQQKGYKKLQENLFGI